MIDTWLLSLFLCVCVFVCIHTECLLCFLCVFSSMYILYMFTVRVRDVCVCLPVATPLLFICAYCRLLLVCVSVPVCLRE